MTTIIKNQSGACVAQSHDLRAMLRGAGLYGGVSKIEVLPLSLPSFGANNQPLGMSKSATVRAHFANGYTGETVFSSFSHAVEWAWARADSSPRASWWAGCDVFAPGADLDDFTHAYLVCALWSSNDEAGEPLDNEYDVADIGDDFRAQAIADCHEFQRQQKTDLAQAYKLYGAGSGEHSPQARAGHDFWLTRNGHGAGFWDRGFKQVGERLSDAAKLCGSVDLFPHDMREPPAPPVAVPVGHTYRTACGRGRISYRPDWSISKPWASYIDGTAGQHFVVEADAVAYFAEQNMTLKIEG
jgi:hypothetical protein